MTDIFLSAGNSHGVCAFGGGGGGGGSEGKMAAPSKTVF